MIIHLIPLPPSPGREGGNMLIINGKSPPSWGGVGERLKKYKLRIPVQISNNYYLIL
jgi:hypothetical protein